MAGIVISFGGLGKQACVQVVHGLDALIASAGDGQDAQARAATFSVLAVDAFSQPDHDAFGPGNVLIMPRYPFGINDQVTSLWSDGRDPFFREWWRAENGMPYRPGNFHRGTSGDRWKSKLAFRLALGDPTGNLATVVNTCVERTLDAMGAMPYDRDLVIPVYLVGSLGGGDASGKQPWMLGSHDPTAASRMLVGGRADPGMDARLGQTAVLH